MAEKYGFFDAVMTNGTPDRIYSANDLNDIFKGILSDGVFRLYDGALKVTANSGLSVNIDTGKAIVKGHWYLNTTIKSMTLITAHATLNRYSSVVLRYSRSDRSVTLAIIDGEPASSPVVPNLTQNNDTYELKLADILVNAGATELTDDDITDGRTYAGGIVDAPAMYYRRYTETIGSSTRRYFDIPDSYNLTTNTLLQVYSGGKLCASDEYYLQINEVEGNMMVVFNEAQASGNVIDIIMIN